MVELQFIIFEVKLLFNENNTYKHNKLKTYSKQFFIILFTNWIEIMMFIIHIQHCAWSEVGWPPCEGNKKVAVATGGEGKCIMDYVVTVLDIS